MSADKAPCCDDGPPGHTQQQHHDASPCYDRTCRFDHPKGGPYRHPCDERTHFYGDGCPEHDKEPAVMGWNEMGGRGLTPQERADIDAADDDD